MSIEAMKQALENELSASDFIDKAPQSWDKTERTEWARLQAMLHNIRVFKKAMRQAIAEAEKQEPMAEVINDRGDVDYISYVPPIGTKLYTHPQPKREWVGLTDEERMAIPPMHSNGGELAYAEAIEAKLKEKNT